MSMYKNNFFSLIKFRIFYNALFSSINFFIFPS